MDEIKKDETIIVRVTKEVKQKIRRLAKKEHQTISDYVRDKLNKINDQTT